MAENQISDFKFYLNFAKPLVLNLPELNDRTLAASWVKMLIEVNADEDIKTKYLKLLLFTLQRKKLLGIFKEDPATIATLEPFAESNIINVARKYIEEDTVNKIQEFGDYPPIMTDYSPNLLEYVSVQKIPNFGAHAYFALSKEPIPCWNRVENCLFDKVTDSMVKIIGDLPKIPETYPEIPTTQRKRKRKSFLSEFPVVATLGKVEPETETRPAPPTWGSNLIEVKETLKDDLDDIEAEEGLRLKALEDLDDITKHLDTCESILSEFRKIDGKNTTPLPPELLADDSDDDINDYPDNCPTMSTPNSNRDSEVQKILDLATSVITLASSVGECCSRSNSQASPSSSDFNRTSSYYMPKPQATYSGTASWQQNQQPSYPFTGGPSDPSSNCMCCQSPNPKGETCSPQVRQMLTDIVQDINKVIQDNCPCEQNFQSDSNYQQYQQPQYAEQKQQCQQCPSEYSANNYPKAASPYKQYNANEQYVDAQSSGTLPPSVSRSQQVSFNISAGSREARDIYTDYAQTFAGFDQYEEVPDVTCMENEPNEAVKVLFCKNDSEFFDYAAQPLIHSPSIEDVQLIAMHARELREQSPALSSSQPVTVPRPLPSPRRTGESPPTPKYE